MGWFIVILGVIAGALFWDAMLRANEKTAKATSAANQLIAMAPEQKARIAAALERRQAQIKEQDRKYKRNLFLWVGIVGMLFLAYLFHHPRAAKTAATPAAVTLAPVSPPSDPSPVSTSSSPAARPTSPSPPSTSPSPPARFWISPQ
jgi:hypothetical protein